MNLVAFAEKFAKFVGINAKLSCPEEITFGSMGNLLGSANRQSYLEDDDEILERFGLDRLSRRRGLEFGENLINYKAEKEDLFKAAKSYYMNETLIPELERIYVDKIPLASGHPVHYIVETDDRDTRREIYKILLDALYSNCRLGNCRYSFLDFHPGENYSKMAYEALYKVSDGGAVVVRYLAGDDSRVYSAFAARKGLASGNPGTLQPTLKFRHLLTRLSFEVKGGEAAVCEGGTKEIFVDAIKVKSLTTGDFVMAYTGAERSQISFDAGSEQFLTLKQRPSASQNEDLIDLVPVTPGVDGSGEPAFTSVGEALLVAPADENGYEISVLLRQNVVVDTDGNKEDKTYEYKAYITNKKNDKPENLNKPFEAGKSYNVKITIWGLSEITITTALEKWEDGGNIDLPIEDEQF
jgi:hypothetical protein